jgi:uncharacterized membrane protein (DUF485 family)
VTRVTPSCTEVAVTEPTVQQKQQVYQSIAKSDDFRELRKRYRNFAFPWTIAFMAWYLLYVVCANWAPGFMSAKVLGNINVALVFGLLQFVSTFVIAYLYSRHANKSLDPIADRLNAEYRKGISA